MKLTRAQAQCLRPPAISRPFLALPQYLPHRLPLSLSLCPQMFPCKCQCPMALRPPPQGRRRYRRRPTGPTPPASPQRRWAPNGRRSLSPSSHKPTLGLTRTPSATQLGPGNGRGNLTDPAARRTRTTTRTTTDTTSRGGTTTTTTTARGRDRDECAQGYAGEVGCRRRRRPHHRRRHCHQARLYEGSSTTQDFEEDDSRLRNTHKRPNRRRHQWLAAREPSLKLCRR